ncbi:MAG: signal peptidase I [Candidatus Paceibacterota bacterium]
MTDYTNKTDFSTDVQNTQITPGPSESQEETPTPQNTTPPAKKENFAFELLKIALFAIIIVTPVRMFIAQPFVVSGASMDDTFSHGQYLIVDQVNYHFKEPERGDVIIFRFPLEPSKFFIKRVIGLPQETVILQGKVTIILNEENPAGVVLDEWYLNPERENNNSSSVTLGDDEYFVMGDNRAESSDSRSWGPLDRGFILGKAFLRLFPITSFSILPGQ